MRCIEHVIERISVQHVITCPKSVVVALPSQMLKLGRIQTFVGKAMQPPSMEALDHAISTLVNLVGSSRITPWSNSPMTYSR